MNYTLYEKTIKDIPNDWELGKALRSLIPFSISKLVPNDRELGTLCRADAFFFKKKKYSKLIEWPSEITI